MNEYVLAKLVTFGDGKQWPLDIIYDFQITNGEGGLLITKVQSDTIPLDGYTLMSRGACEWLIAQNRESWLAHLADIDSKKVPTEVTPRQIRQALFLKGVTLQTIQDMINMYPEPTKTMATIEWEYSTVVYRFNPLVNQMAQALGWNSQDVDDLFIQARNL